MRPGAVRRFVGRLRHTMSCFLSVVLRLWRRTVRYLRAVADWVLGRGDEPQSPGEACLPPRPEEYQPIGGQREAESWVSEEEEDEEEWDSEGRKVDDTDEYYSGYDSTWESEGTEERPAASSPVRMQRWNHDRSSPKFNRLQKAARDMQNYRHNYPSPVRMQRWNHDRSSEDNPNLEFYLGKRPSLPDGIYIQDFHGTWFGDYKQLEYVHTYIQWLFPLQEPGMNQNASTLTRKEIEAFLRDNTAKENLLRSYELMLNFYGIELVDYNTGKVKRASNWKERFRNLNNHTHNSLRITRILKCLGTLGFQRYQAPLVHFFLEETLVHRELQNVKDSVLTYFVFAVLDKKQRRRLIKFAYCNYDRKDEFVWCPRKIQMLWSEQSASVAREGAEGQYNV